MIEIASYLPDPWRQALSFESSSLGEELEEVRMRVNRPVMLYGRFGQKPLCPTVVPSGAELAELVLRLANHSLYTREEELRQGYLSLPGGYRVGLAGKAVWHDGRIVTVRDICGVNFRVAREWRAGGDALLRRLGNPRPQSILVISPPRAGKTSLIRDVARIWSDGGTVTVMIDERGELAAMNGGMPAFDIGLHTDVLDAWEKDAGIRVAVRTLAPELIVVDELGHPSDVDAIEFAKRSGVEVIASAHADGLSDLRHKPAIWHLWQGGTFAVLVVLTRQPTAGTVAEVRWRWPQRQAGLG